MLSKLIDVGLPTALFSQPFSGHGWMYFPQWHKQGKKVVLLPTSDWGELEKVPGLLRAAGWMKRPRILAIDGPKGTPAARRLFLQWGEDVIKGDVMTLLHRAVYCPDAYDSSQDGLSRPSCLFTPLRIPHNQVRPDHEKEPLVQVQPYLFFDGRCDEALEFYRTALGAETTFLMRFKESPDPDACPPGAEEKVMHSNLRIGDTTLLASDGRCTGQANFQGFSLSITVNDAAEAERVFAALSDGGQVQMPLTETFFSPRFGMVADRFGVSWMIIVAG